MRRPARPWPPRLPCFVPRLGDYLGRLEQQPMAALLARPHALGRALRRASELLGLEVECLEVPAAWLASEDERPRLAVREGLRTLRAPQRDAAPATLIAVPSPVTLAQAMAEDEGRARAVLQGFLRSLGELDVLAGVMFEGDDGAAALGGILAHYGMTAICIRRAGDAVMPPGVLVARVLSMAELTAAAVGTAGLVTTDGPVDPTVAPEELLAVSRAVARVNGRQT